jgi:flagellum-specific peptidoglycan hydrolase FlgJ
MPPQNEEEWKKQLGPMSQKKIDFFNKIYDDADRASKVLGIPTTFLMAQNAFESGWGGSKLAQEQNNLGGVKVGKNEPGKLYPSAEGYGATRRIEVSKFGAYPNQSAFYDKWADRLNKKQYEDARKAQTIEDYAKGLKKGGYFTEDLGTYSKGLNSLWKDMKLILENTPAVDPSVIESRMAGTKE